MDQAVLIIFPLSDSKFGTSEERDVLGQLGEDLAATIEDAGIGEFDGNDIGEGVYTFYLYANDADELLEAVEPLLYFVDWPTQITAVKRYGPPGAKEVKVVIEVDDEGQE